MHNPFLVAALLVLFSGSTLAEADGPGDYRVRDISGNDTLDIRAEPHPDASWLGVIQPDGDCIRNLVCQGGLSYQEFTTLS